MLTAVKIHTEMLISCKTVVKKSKCSCCDFIKIIQKWLQPYYLLKQPASWLITISASNKIIVALVCRVEVP